MTKVCFKQESKREARGRETSKHLRWVRSRVISLIDVVQMRSFVGGVGEEERGEEERGGGEGRKEGRSISRSRDSCQRATASRICLEAHTKHIQHSGCSRESPYRLQPNARPDHRYRRRRRGCPPRRPPPPGCGGIAQSRTAARRGRVRRSTTLGGSASRAEVLRRSRFVPI